MNSQDIPFIQMLLARLEKISADSVWAHRASGVRGAMLRALEKIEKGRTVPPSGLKRMQDQGFYILEQAAKERIHPR